MPGTLTFLKASTLSCAAVTAWSALYGGKPLLPGHYVLPHGTGGLALAAGARVIATTSSDDKAERLKKLGVETVINYAQDPAWGETAKSFTPGNRGFQHIIEVGGGGTMAQSLKAVAIDGAISIVGFLTGDVKQ
ncbi:MAG: hypothetical protein M1838_003541 [Thelocarpon superellum]|nr:MAG: hypothetical protein M1838_003541 [Thelocarpon superellum]